MKKTLFLALLVTPLLTPVAHAAAGDGCAGDGVSVTITGGGATNFAKRDFSAKCSNNVLSKYAEDNTSFGVVAGSKKGKNFFGGGTGGGGIKLMGSCAATGCSATEITTTAAGTARTAS